MLLQKLMSLYWVLLHPLFNGCMEVGKSCPEAKQGRDGRLLAHDITVNTHNLQILKPSKQTRWSSDIPGALLPDVFFAVTCKHMDNSSWCLRLPLGSRNILCKSLTLSDMSLTYQTQKTCIKSLFIRIRTGGRKL